MRSSTAKALRPLSIVAVLLVLGIGLAYLSGTFRMPVEPVVVETESGVPDGRATDVIREVVEVEMAETTGTLRAARPAPISSGIEARIREIPVRRGDRVFEGDVLVRLDNGKPRGSLDRARQEMAAADANLARAEAELEAIRAPGPDSSVSQEELGKKADAVSAAKTRVELAHEAANKAGDELSHTMIRAPGDGIVAEVLAKVGDMAAPDEPILTLQDEDTLELEAAFPLGRTPDVNPGDRIDVTFAPLDAPIRGAVQFVEEGESGAGGPALVRIVLARQEELAEGMIGTLRIPVGERARRLVPSAAIRDAAPLSFVEVVGEQGRIEARQVLLGDRREDGRVEVLSGVQPGERVILQAALPDVPADGMAPVN